MILSLLFLQVIVPWSHALPEKARIELFIPGESRIQDKKPDSLALPPTAFSPGSVYEEAPAERFVAPPVVETVGTLAQPDPTNYPHDWLDPGFA